MDLTGNDLHCGYLDVVALFPLLGTDTRPSLFPDDQTPSLFVTTDVFHSGRGVSAGCQTLVLIIFFEINLLPHPRYTLDEGCGHDEVLTHRVWEYYS